MAAIKTEVMSVKEAREYFATGGKGKAKMSRKKTAIEKQLEKELQRHRIKELSKATGQEVVAEFKFHPDRQWRFDFYLPASRVGIEVEGGVWKDGGGRHNRGQGYIDDCEKYNHAQLLGFKVLRFTPEQLLKPKALKTIRKALEGSVSVSE